MADEKPKYDLKAKRKVRAEKYEEKVKFDGTLEQMITMAGKTKLPKEKDQK
ncbi:MAG TPA: hypothetical protein VHE59_11690 [Mucilaginibacter sp.]|nr:hypothetical protein [Mucilaginibacter sp.]